MNLKKEEIEILQLLISSNDFISTYEISTSINISRRLVRSKMNLIKDILSDIGLTLISKPSKGYLIENKTLDIINSLQSLIDSNNNDTDTLFPTLPNERQTYIQKRLVESLNYIKMDDLADELLVSRSTIANDLIQIKKEIKKYNLTIIHKPNYGLSIEGEEISKRKAISDHLFSNLESAHMSYDFIDSFYKSSDFKIIEILNNYNIEMSDIGLIDFLLNISTTLVRVKNGASLSTPFLNFECFIDSYEYKAAQEISMYIKNTTSIDLNDFEVQGIAILLICKHSTHNNNYVECIQTNEILNQILEKIKEKTLVTFSDKIFLKNLFLYVEAALIRQKYNEKIRTPIYEDIKQAFPLAYYISLLCSDIFQKNTNQPLSRSEIASFSTLFNNALRSQYKAKTKVLIINSLGLSYAKYCKFIINEHFHNQLVVKSIIQYYKIFEEDLSKYNLIITTKQIHRELPIPTINISYMINQDDMNKINHYLSYHDKYNNLIYYFHPQLFENHITAKTLKGVISAVYKTLKRVYPHLNDTIKSEICNKQHCSLKIINHSIALVKLDNPISRYDCITTIITENPIEWDNDTFQILMLYSCNDSNIYIYNLLYSILNNITLNKEKIELLNSELTYTKFLKLLLDSKKIIQKNK